MIYFDMDGVLAKYYTLEEIGDISRINEKGISEISHLSKEGWSF